MITAARLSVLTLLAGLLPAAAWSQAALAPVLCTPGGTGCQRSSRSTCSRNAAARRRSLIDALARRCQATVPATSTTASGTTRQACPGPGWKTAVRATSARRRSWDHGQMEVVVEVGGW